MRIDKKWCEANRNEKFANTAFQRGVEYGGKSTGAYRYLRWMENAAKGVEETGIYASKNLTYFIKNTGAASSALGLFRVAPTLRRAQESGLDLIRNDDKSIPFQRKAMKAACDAADSVSACGYAALFVLRAPIILPFARVADLTSDMINLPMTASDCWRASTLQARAKDPEVSKALAHTKKFNLFCVARMIITIASGVLGVVAFATGLALLPTLASIGTSLVGTTVGIIKDNYKDMGKYKVIDFDQHVTV